MQKANGVTAVMLASLFAAGCVSTASYTPPAPQTDRDKSYSATIDRPYDETWSALVRYAAGTFFAIDNFEKDSGLLTLSFGSDNASAFIDCGRMAATWTNQQYQKQEYSGTYVDYMVMYYSGSFTGRMNLLVSEVQPGTSEITVNARYVFHAPPNTWSFDSGGRATVYVANAAQSVSSPARTCQPTYKAEKAILDAVTNF